MKTFIAFALLIAAVAANPASADRMAKNADLMAKVQLSTTDDAYCGTPAKRTFVSTGNRYFGNPSDKSENLVTTSVEELYMELREKALEANPKANRIVGVRTEMAAGPAPMLNTLYVHVYGMAVEC